MTETELQPQTVAPAPVTVPVAVANLRTGCATTGPNNIITKIAAGNYPAIKQCVGQSVTLGGAVNDWWVQITAGTLTGWVSAVVVEVGGNNLPIPNVLQAQTVNV